MTRYLEETLAEFCSDVALAAAKSAMVRVNEVSARLPVEARLASSEGEGTSVAVRADVPLVTWRGALEPDLGILSFRLKREDTS